MKILVINDIHAAATPPRGCRSVYSTDIFNMLEEIRNICVDNQVYLTILTGDLFHHKQNVADWLKEKLIQTFKYWPTEVISIVGNHDLGAAGINSIVSQPIGILFAADVIHWLQADEIRKYGEIILQLSPANWFDGIDDDPANFGLKRMEGVDWALKISHGSLVVSDKDYPKEFKVVSMQNIPTAGMDFCLNGHIHNDQGIKKINDCIFVSTGSLGRVARTDYNYTKKMRLALLTLEKEEASTKFVYLESAMPVEELFYDKITNVTSELDVALTRFTQNIERNLRVKELSIEEALTSLGKFEPQVVTVVKKHLLAGGWEE